MLSISKKKVSKEYIYVKKYPIPLHSLEDTIQKFKKSENKVADIVNFYTNMLNFEKIRFIIKLASNSDGKKPLNINQVEEYIRQMLTEAVTNFISNPMDSFYVSESIILSVTNYSGKHYISISPRIDFSK